MNLNELLGEDLAKQVNEKIGDKKLGIINDGSYVPIDKFNSKLEELKITNNQIEEFKSNGLEVEKLLGENEDLKSKYNELKINHESSIEKYEQKISNNNKIQVLSKALKENGAVYEDLLIGKIDLEAINVDGEKIENFEKIVSPLKEKYGNMFEVEEVKGNKPNAGNAGNEESSSPGNEFSYMDDIKY